MLHTWKHVNSWGLVGVQCEVMCSAHSQCTLPLTVASWAAASIGSTAYGTEMTVCADTPCDRHCTDSQDEQRA